MNFTAIDFETATGARNSACSIGLVVVENGIIVDEYHSLIQPPDNFYNWHNTNVHGISAQDTWNAPAFHKIYPEIKKRMQGRTIVAHNEAFDRGVLQSTMALYRLDYDELELPKMWECTVKIYKKKDVKPTKLSDCCRLLGIDLKHHDALSDARACAKLYLLR